MTKHLLTDRRVRAARPKLKPYRLHDGDGLALWVSPNGVRSWVFRYRLNGKEQTTTLGRFNTMSLAEARDEAAVARKRVAGGEHLTLLKRIAVLRRSAESANTFGAFAAAWTEREARRMKWSADYHDEVAASLRNHLRQLDVVPLTQITAALVSPILLAVEHSAPQMLEKVRRRLRAILDDAVEHGVIVGNPLPAVRRRRNPERKHYPAIVDPAGIGAVLRAAAASDPCKGIQRAHLLLAFTAQRVSEVVNAAWSEFDLQAGKWAIPRQRMKRKDEARGPHVIPLPPALLSSLREWRKADGTDARYVCPAPRDAAKPITPEAVEKHYRSALALGGKHSPHSWRSSFSTICREAGKDADSVEAQLDHVVGTTVAAAYDRSKRLELRRALLAWYEATLIAARDGAAVLPIKRRVR